MKRKMKLNLNKQTVAHLSAQALRAARGGLDSVDVCLITEDTVCYCVITETCICIEPTQIPEYCPVITYFC